MSDVAGVIVAQPFGRLRQFRRRTKALHERLYHHVADELTADAGCRSGERSSLAIAAVQAESGTDPFAVVTADLKAVRAIALIAALNRDGPLMRQAERGRTCVLLEQQLMSFRESIDTLGVYWALAVSSTKPA